MNSLLEKKCVPCEGAAALLTKKEIEKYKSEISDWQVVDEKKLRKEYTFKDFNEAMVFVIKVARIADLEGHHPDIHISYNRVALELWTHAINGLSENDFVVAAKINKI